MSLYIQASFFNSLHQKPVYPDPKDSIPEQSICKGHNSIAYEFPKASAVYSASTCGNL